MSSRSGLVWQRSSERSAAPLVKAGAGLRRAEAGDRIQFAERCQRLAQEAKWEGRLGGYPLGPPQGEPTGRRPGASDKARLAQSRLPHEEQHRVLAAPRCLHGGGDGGERRLSLQQRNF